MDTALVAGLQQAGPVKATLVRIDLSAGAICLTDSGFAVFNGETYHGKHPTHGVLSSVSSVADGAESTTTRIEITLLPDDAASAAVLGAPAVQGTRVQWWEAVIDPATGGLIGQPLLKFDGEIDKPRLNVGASWALVLDCGTQAERQLEPNADWRLNHAHQSKIWPGDTGLINVTNVVRKLGLRVGTNNTAVTIGGGNSRGGGQTNSS